MQKKYLEIPLNFAKTASITEKKFYSRQILYQCLEKFL
jgi:hypothetical protein